MRQFQCPLPGNLCGGDAQFLKGAENLPSFDQTQTAPPDRLQNGIGDLVGEQGGSKKGNLSLNVRPYQRLGSNPAFLIRKEPLEHHTGVYDHARSSSSWREDS